MNLLQQRAKALIAQHGGVVKAARASRINRTVLRLLADGARDSCSPATLRKLGLRPAGYEPISQERIDAL
jgi:hypothetical protein